ncbi:MAG: hypothetical protein ACJ8KO_13230, partial [Sulfurifustaceae bacterium]
EGRLVVLNKIDTLWDELRTMEAISGSLNRQIEETARVLGVNRRHVFPVSAQKALLGKIKADHALITKSGLVSLEQKLSTDILSAKQQLMREKMTREIGAIIERTRALISSRLASIDVQLVELKSLSGKSQTAIQQMINHMRREKQAYDKTLESFQATRMMLSEHTKLLLDFLTVESIDALIAHTRKTMKESWTTHGLQLGMKTLFDGVTETMEKAHRQAEQIVGLVGAIYHRFHTEHGFADLRPTSFSLAPFREQLERLYDEAEAFRKSPIMVMTEQHFVIKRFFITLASRARVLFTDCNGAAREWNKAIMAPILTQVREHKIMMDHRLDNLKRVHENLDNLSGRIGDLETTKLNLENQLVVIDNMLRKIHQPLGARLDS